MDQCEALQLLNLGRGKAAHYFACKLIQALQNQGVGNLRDDNIRRSLKFHFRNQAIGRTPHAALNRRLIGPAVSDL